MRVKTSVSSKKRKKRLLKQTKGFWGQRKNVFRRAKETLLRSLAFSYRDRRVKKKDFQSTLDCSDQRRMSKQWYNVQ